MKKYLFNHKLSKLIYIYFILNETLFFFLKPILNETQYIKLLMKSYFQLFVKIDHGTNGLRVQLNGPFEVILQTWASSLVIMGLSINYN